MPFRDQFTTNEEYNQWFRVYRFKNAEKIRKYNREYNKIYRMEHGYYNEMNSKRRYPKKQSARRKLERAILSGKLKRKPCEVCGKKKYIQAHHEDYSKPLEVVWLCALHHKDKHRKISTS